jgi:hypothetical protein
MTATKPKSAGQCETPVGGAKLSWRTTAANRPAWVWSSRAWRSNFAGPGPAVDGPYRQMRPALGCAGTRGGPGKVLKTSWKAATEPGQPVATSTRNLGVRDTCQTGVAALAGGGWACSAQSTAEIAAAAATTPGLFMGDARSFLTPASPARPARSCPATAFITRLVHAREPEQPVGSGHGGPAWAPGWPRGHRAGPRGHWAGPRGHWAGTARVAAIRPEGRSPSSSESERLRR